MTTDPSQTNGAAAPQFASADRIGAAADARLEYARQRARALDLPYAGSIGPEDAHAILEAGGAVLVDVRTAEELKFVGSVPGSIHVAWQTGPAMIRNPRFLKELSAKVPQDSLVFFICRSGKRSSEASAAAAKAGYVQAFNVLEGFEGDGSPDAGWRNRGLPCV